MTATMSLFARGYCFLVKAAASEISLLIILALSYACALQSATLIYYFHVFLKCFFQLFDLYAVP